MRRRVRSGWMGTACLAGLFLLLSGLTVISYRSLGGLSAQVILSGSMRPALRPGSLVISQEQAPAHYAVGDIVTFRPPLPGQPLVTHRLVGLRSAGRGRLLFRTKGDANPTEDAWTIAPGAIVGKQLIALPWLGYPLAWARTRLGFLLCALAFFLLFVAKEIWFWREAVTAWWREKGAANISVN